MEVNMLLNTVRTKFKELRLKYAHEPIVDKDDIKEGDYFIDEYIYFPSLYKGVLNAEGDLCVHVTEYGAEVAPNYVVNVIPLRQLKQPMGLRYISETEYERLIHLIHKQAVLKVLSIKTN